MQSDDDTEMNPATNLGTLKNGLRDTLWVSELRLPVLNHALQITKATVGFEASLPPNALSNIQI